MSEDSPISTWEPINLIPDIKCTSFHKCLHVIRAKKFTAKFKLLHKNRAKFYVCELQHVQRGASINYVTFLASTFLVRFMISINQVGGERVSKNRKNSLRNLWKHLQTLLFLNCFPIFFCETKIIKKHFCWCVFYWTCIVNSIKCWNVNVDSGIVVYLKLGFSFCGNTQITWEMRKIFCNYEKHQTFLKFSFCVLELNLNSMFTDELKLTNVGPKMKNM